MPTDLHVFRAAGDNNGTVLLDVVDGHAMVKPDRPLPPWPSLCATPCALTLPRGDHRVTLEITDEFGNPYLDRTTLHVTELPKVHRRALTRFKVERSGLYHTANLLGLIGVPLIVGGLSVLPFVERDQRLAYGIVVSSGALLVSASLIFRAFSGKGLRGSEVVFPLPPAVK